MPVANTVDSELAALYLGEDQAVFIDVDTSLDDSDIPVADWTVEARFANERVPLKAAIVHPDLVVTLSYALIPNPGLIDINRFQGTLGASDSATLLKAGDITMEIWRTNLAANKMLYRVDFKGYATESHS